MSAEVTAGFIAFLLAGMAATALGMRELFRQTRILWRDVERLQDDFIRSGPNLGEVELLREQLAELTKMRREVCEAIEINSNVVTPEQVEEGTGVEALVSMHRELCAALGMGPRADPAKVASAVLEWKHQARLKAERNVDGSPYTFSKIPPEVLVFTTTNDVVRVRLLLDDGEGCVITPDEAREVCRQIAEKLQTVEFSPVPPPRVKKPRKPRKPKTTEQAIGEAAQTSLETAIAEVAEQEAVDDANGFVSPEAQS